MQSCISVAIARMMRLTNAITEHGSSVSYPVLQEAMQTLLLLMAPFSPHFGMLEGAKRAVLSFFFFSLSVLIIYFLVMNAFPCI